MYKNKLPLFLLILIVLLMFVVTTLFIGCGRRARVAEALREKESEDTADEVKEEDAELEESLEAENTINEEASEEEIFEEPIEEDEDNQAEESIEEVNVEPEEEVEEEIVEDESSQENEEEQQSGGIISIGTISDMPIITEEGGTLWERSGKVIEDDNELWVGDSGFTMEASRGFISFDISNLADSTILDARLTATCYEKDGTPFINYGPIIIKAVYWGPTEITLGIFEIDGIELANFSSKDFGIGNKKLKDDLQNAVNNGLDRYQICLYFEIDSALRGNILKYKQKDIKLNVKNKIRLDD